MAIQSLTDLKALINSTIYDNPSQEISGGDVQTALINAIDTLDSAEGFVNVHKANGQTTITAYGSKSAARGAVPADLHYQGIVIAYKISTGWLIEQNLDATAGTWGDDASWQTIGPVSVSQNTLSIGDNYAGEMSTTYDVTLHNNDATFVSLEALLSDINLDTLIPLAVRKGGMSIKFVLSPDNNYVQYRYQGTSTVNADFTNVANWYKTESNVDVDSGIGDELFDLDIADKSGNVLLRLSNGNIKTKDFDSTKTPSEYHTPKSDLDVVDEDGYVLLRLALGHIFTKNFNSMSGGGSSEGGQWDGKIWYAYGTSLTENTVGGRGHYTDVVAQLSNLQQFNKGIGGGGITDYSNKSVYNAVINPNDGKVNADIITLEVGANDAGAPIGTIYDETTATFCGALNLCIRALQTLTTAQIIVISSTNAAYNTSTSSYATPSTQYGPDNHTKYDQWKATEEVCKINSVYYVPMGEDGGLGYARLRQDYDGEHLYIEDAIHYTPLGALILGKFVWERIKMISTFN